MSWKLGVEKIAWAPESSGSRDGLRTNAVDRLEYRIKIHIERDEANAAMSEGGRPRRCSKQGLSWRMKTATALVQIQT